MHAGLLNPAGTIPKYKSGEAESACMVRVTIDRGACVSCGSCWDTCPAFFEQNPDDSFSEVIGEFREAGSLAVGSAPDDLEACVRDAADLCPVQIIAVGD